MKQTMPPISRKPKGFTAQRTESARPYFLRCLGGPGGQSSCRLSHNLPREALFLLGAMVLLCLLPGCQTATPTSPTVTGIPPSAVPTRTPIPTWTPTATPVPATPFPTRTAPAPPSPTATATPVPACAAIWRRSFPKAEPLHDVILFISAVDAPFAPTPIRLRDTVHLWAVAADGRRSERLSDEANIIHIRPAADTVVIDLLTTQAITLETALVRPHRLPAECSAYPCNPYRFSPDGSWVAFFWGEEICGRGIAALNLRTDEMLILAERGGHHFTFLSDTQMLIGVGHCEGGHVIKVNLTTGEQEMLGEDGVRQWNPTQTALAVNVHPYLGWGSVVWGYDLVRQQHFIPPTRQQATEESQPLWTPAGDYLLYQQRVISYTTPTRAALTLGPQQIRLVNVATGESRTLLADPAYDYHLCMAYGVCAWEGDFIEIRRIAYRPQVFTWEDDPQRRAVSCAVYGFRCAEPVERFALHWRTGELLPWDQRPAALQVTPTPTPSAATPTPTPMPPAPPDLSGPPFYTAPDGRYVLRLGQDGQSLWCIPTDGEAVLWIKNGSYFTYLP